MGHLRTPSQIRAVARTPVEEQIPAVRIPGADLTREVARRLEVAPTREEGPIREAARPLEEVPTREAGGTTAGTMEEATIMGAENLAAMMAVGAEEAGATVIMEVAGLEAIAVTAGAEEAGVVIAGIIMAAAGPEAVTIAEAENQGATVEAARPAGMTTEEGSPAGTAEDDRVVMAATAPVAEIMAVAAAITETSARASERRGASAPLLLNWRPKKMLTRRRAACPRLSQERLVDQRRRFDRR